MVLVQLPNKKAKQSYMHSVPSYHELLFGKPKPRKNPDAKEMLNALIAHGKTPPQ